MSVPLKTQALLRPRALVTRYHNRLRIHIVQELFACIGIATAVALISATLVASQNVSTSANAVVRTLAGSATLQLRSRSNEGFDEKVLARIERLPNVAQTAALLEQTGTIAGRDNRRITVDVIGAGVALARLDGLASTLPTSILSEGIGLSKPTTDALGITSDIARTRAPYNVSLFLNGRTTVLPVSAVLTHQTGGAIAGALVAVMPLSHLQTISGLRGRVSRVLVRPSSGHGAPVRTELQHVASGRLTIASATQDIGLLQKVLSPSNQASEFFAVIAALLGFLFAFNAMLSTVPERRLEIADMRMDGARSSTIIQMLLFQALCLGIFSSLVGLTGGYFLLRDVFHESPGYLSQAFIVGSNINVWAVRPLLFSLMSGLIATCIASTVPLLDLRRARSITAVYFEDGTPGQSLSSGTTRRMFGAAIVFITLAGILLALARSYALIVCAMLALATVLAVPAMLSSILYITGIVAERNHRLTLLSVALTSLRATTIRSLALVATGAVALFGAVALSGSRNNLLSGLHSFGRAYVSGADLWIRNPGSTPDTTGFQIGSRVAAIARVPGVRSARIFHSEFMSTGNRRIVVLARPPETSSALLRTQMITGDPTYVQYRLHEGGWVTVSDQIAREQRVSLGGFIRLPTPTGIALLHLAGTTTNLTWPGGAVLMSNRDYAHLWKTTGAGEIGVTLATGANIFRVRSEIASVLRSSSLEMVTSRTWADRFNKSASEGLSKLAWISTLLIVAAIVAMATALTSATWQQRTTLAGRRVEGVEPARLRRLLLIEAGIILGAGCFTGAIGGILGQVAIDSYLKNVSGFPIASIAAGPRPLEVFAIVMSTVLILAWIPRWLASRVPPALAPTSE